MILVTELAAAPILSKADPDVLALVSQFAADIRLGAGEYAAHEGDERALYVVLSGHIEVTKRFDGIERVIGKRAPGHSRRASAGAAWRSRGSIGCWERASFTARRAARRA